MIHKDVACPFCGLVCDDLEIEAKEDGSLDPGDKACARGRAAFARANEAAPPTIGGRKAEPEEAAAEIARLLGQARLPLFAGLGADVEGLRGLYGLADRCGGVVDHMGSRGLFQNVSVMTERGWMTTTLSEVRNRADLLLIVGPDPEKSFPRFFERVLADQPTLFQDRPLKRRILRLGPDDAGGRGEILACALDDLPQAVALLRAFLSDPDRPLGPLAGSAAERLPVEALRQLARDLPGASYGVVAWSAGAFDPRWGPLVIENVSELVRSLNAKTRFSGLPLGGDDNIIGANQIVTWQSGYPLRTAFTGGTPEHDERRFATQRLLDSEEADLLVWVSAFQPAPPPASELPLIHLGLPGAETGREAVFVPIATPGVDHAGRFFRTDSVVALPLRQLREGKRPSVAALCRMIETRLASQEAEPALAGADAP